MTYPYAGTIRDLAGRAATATSVTLYTDSAGTTAATGVTDWSGGALTNPVTTDARGKLAVRHTSPALYYVVSGDTAVQRLLRFYDDVKTVTVTDEEYGAAGDGATDDTAAIQAAIDAACASGGTVIFPSTGSYYRVTDTLEIRPAGADTQVSLNLRAEGSWPNITWDGADDTAVFHAIAWKHATVQNVMISLPDTSSGVTCWDIDTETVLTSTQSVTFDGCDCSLGTGEHNVGWRMGHVSDGIGDISVYQWRNCSCAGGASGGVHGQVGWLNEGGNSVQHSWYGCFGWYLEKQFSNVSGPGAAALIGNGCMYYYGCGGSGNGTDFEEGNVYSQSVFGGRWELGDRFYHSTSASHNPTFTVSGVEIESYAPADGALFYMEKQTSLVLDNVSIRKDAGTPYTSAMISLIAWSAATRGTVICNGGVYYADDPFFTENSGWDVYVKGVGKLTDGWFVAPTKFGEGAPSAVTISPTLNISAVSTHATTPTVTVDAAHGMVSGDWVHIDGITELAAGYYQVAATGVSTTFTVSGTTTGTDTGTCQPCYTSRSAHDQHIAVTGGTVTAIAISTDKGTTFTSTGLTTGIFPLRAWDVLHITNSSAPTTTAIPRP